MRYTIVATAFVIGLLFSSCKKDENPVTAQPASTFNLKISVKNTDGSPKSNVRIDGWHYLPSAGKWLALSVYKYYLLTKFVDDSLHVTQTRDTTVYFAFGSEIAEDALVGYTELNGIYQCNNPRRFPNVFNLPSHVDSKDTVKFVLSSGNRSMVVFKEIQYAENSIDVVWNPSTTTLAEHFGSSEIRYYNIFETHITRSRVQGDPDLSTSSDTCIGPLVTISFELAEPAIVSLRIYDLLDRTWADLVDGELFDEGSSEVEFTGCHLQARYNDCY